MDRRLVLPMTLVVLAIWLLGTWVTKYSLEEMAVYTPIAVAALGALAGIVLLWVKIVRDSLRARPRTRQTRNAAPSDVGRTVESAMRDGSWTIDRCSFADVPALAEALEISETTASILVRRGYGEVETARAFLEGERAPTTRSCSATWREAVDADPRGDRGRQAHLRPRRLRRRRDLRDRACRAHPA